MRALRKLGGILETIWILMFILIAPGGVNSTMSRTTGNILMIAIASIMGLGVYWFSQHINITWE